MPHEVIMPALGMAQTTGLIVAWHKAAGDAVAKGDVLFEVETDKATMEVEAAGDGFLVDVRAGAGEEVPVGDVIARISDSPEADAPATAPEPASIEGHEVIMPALGMAQDTGRIVAWAKAPGDAVAKGDVLFEVETDKATMEVEAGHDGYLAGIYAVKGEDAPVGGVIAVISAEKPADPVSRSIADGAPAQPATPEPAAEAPAQAPQPNVAPTVPSQGGRILASPKARRLAAERGLDLARLVEAGHPQPYHVADLEALATQPAPVATAESQAPHRIEACLPMAAFDAYTAWLAESGDATSPAVLAALASGALREATGQAAIALRLDRPGAKGEAYMDADLNDGAPNNAPPALILRDLTASRLTSMATGPGDAPILTVARDGDAFRVTLDFDARHLDPDTAVAFADGFAARLDDPLRQLF